MGKKAPAEFTGSRIGYATRSAGAFNGVEDQDVNVTDWSVGDDFIVAMAFEEDDSGYYPENSSYRLEWNKDGGTWNALSGTGELNWSASTDLVNGNALVESEAGCTSAEESTFVEGMEREGANDASVVIDAADEWSEIQWAVNCDNATNGSTYGFRLYDIVRSTLIGTGVTITMEAGATPVENRRGIGAGVMRGVGRGTS